MPKAVIVGAGINGLCTARALVLRGWEVEVLEQGPIPNPRAASFDRHRLIRWQYGDPGYAARMPEAFAAWDGLWRDLGRSHYSRRGVLSLSRAEGDATDRVRRTMEAVGAPVEILGPEEVAARFPVFAPTGVRFGVFAPEGGMLMADRILVDLASWLEARRVVLRAGVRVTGADAGTGVVTAGENRFAGDVAILAGGVGLPLLAPELAGDLVPRRAICVYAWPGAGSVKAWAEAPCWSGLGGADDLWGMPPEGDIPMKLGAGTLSVPADPDTGREVRAGDTEAVLERCRGLIRGIGTVERTEVNFYLMAPEERFVLRREGRVVLVSADSGHGFKFGPLTGEDVAGAVEAGEYERVERRMAGALAG